jgi:myo-inositol-1-phosphate synthase
LTKNKFLNMCKKSYNRYKTKIEHVVQHIIDDKSKLNEGLTHFIPSHHIERIKNNKQ